MVRRVDRQGEVLIWSRKCSGNATQKMGPKLMNCSKPEQVGTKEYGKMLKRNQVLEDGRFPAKEARIWKTTTREEYRRLWNEFETVGFVAQKKVCGIPPERKCSRIEVHCLRKVML